MKLDLPPCRQSLLDNDDHILATLGKALLGQSCDESFYEP